MQTIDPQAFVFFATAALTVFVVGREVYDWKKKQRKKRDRHLAELTASAMLQKGYQQRINEVREAVDPLFQMTTYNQAALARLITDALSVDTNRDFGAPAMPIELKIKRLEMLEEAAVARGEFEKAAVIRDQIKELRLE